MVGFASPETLLLDSLLASTSPLLACLLFPFGLSLGFSHIFRKEFSRMSSGQFYPTALHDSLLVLVPVVSCMLMRTTVHEQCKVFPSKLMVSLACPLPFCCLQHLLSPDMHLIPSTPPLVTQFSPVTSLPSKTHLICSIFSETFLTPSSPFLVHSLLLLSS